MPEPSHSEAPDYFDRLLARRPADGVTRARPRLPGPFERAEPRWREETAAAAPVAPSRPYPVDREVDLPPTSWIRVERHTELRTPPPARPEPPEEPAPPGRPWSPAPAPPAAAPPDRTAPRTAPARDGAVHPARPARPERPAPAAAPAATPAAVTAVARAVTPRPGRRDAARTPTPAARRRAPQPSAEPSVHVRIGRLEVRAAGADRAPTPRPARTGRPEPAVTLADYLSGGAARATGAAGEGRP